jgi:hypothetical protein
MRSFIIGKVLPAIRKKWPREDLGKPIFIQQDNARPHIDASDPLFCEATKHEGFDIKLICQPPNSPDFDVLDLGFFASIQSIQIRMLLRHLLNWLRWFRRSLKNMTQLCQIGYSHHCSSP